MASFDDTIELTVPAEQVFDLVADPRTAARWHPAIVRSIRADDAAPVEIGTITDSVYVFYGREIELAFQTVELDRPRRVMAEAASKRARAREQFDIEPTTEGCRLRYRSELTMGGFLRVFDRGLQVMFDGIGRRALDGLRDELG